MRILTAWFERKLGTVVRICDTYFGPQDLSWLQIIRAARPGCRIEVLTARKNQPVTGAGEELEDIYINAWRGRYDQTALCADFAIIGGERTKDSAIHDRSTVDPVPDLLQTLAEMHMWFSAGCGSH